MVKRAILFSLLLLGWTWTLQGDAVDDDQVKAAEGNVEPADAEGRADNVAVDNSTVRDATEPDTALHNATDQARFSALFNATEDCVKEPEVGPCKAKKRRFFYNSTSVSCETFIYGGCGGNQNNFRNEKDCMQKCHPEGQEVLDGEEGEEREEGGEEEGCNQAPVTGPCRAYRERYFYNSTSMSCEKFIYGGCGGNQNNFKNEAMCMQRCHTEEEEHPTSA